MGCLCEFCIRTRCYIVARVPQGANDAHTSTPGPSPGAFSNDGINTSREALFSLMHFCTNRYFHAGHHEAAALLAARTPHTPLQVITAISKL